jgi:hypothetical protein
MVALSPFSNSTRSWSRAGSIIGVAHAKAGNSTVKKTG